MAILTGDELRKKLPVTIALVGVPFSGKTQSIDTLHRYYKRKGLPSHIHLIDYDKKADSLIRCATQNGWLDELFIHRIEVPGGENMSNIEVPTRSREMFELAVGELNSFNKIDLSKVGAIVHDSYTELVDILWSGILAMRGVEIGGSVMGADHKPNPRKGDDAEGIEFTEWRLLREKVIEYIRVSKSFPVDRVFVFHEEWWVEELRGGDPKKPQITTTGRKLRLPIGGTRRLSASLGKYFNLMLYTKVETSGWGDQQKTTYKWETAQNDTIPSAGTSLREGLPPTVDQDFAKVLD